MGKNYLPTHLENYESGDSKHFLRMAQWLFAFNKICFLIIQAKYTIIIDQLTFHISV